MSHITFEQEEIAVMTELNEEEISAVIGGTGSDDDFLDVGNVNILNGSLNDINVNVLGIQNTNVAAGLLGGLAKLFAAN
ncbi:hypothetical protein H6G93_37760 [Nostoc sp. FACHB-973]|uniref:Bacteriocin n=1 Tax=Desmonostoc muscorum LEGE 12446 TaxID=1828758 RepID=A0A8J7ACI7_DESMC|nr:hypothetical protein [Desmonostoc muscorum]MBD2520590.1 hypothetical protein [Nostoc sp. FACHB-973]MCF2149575.1 hypothetical protein [Desmonostoc muscorum LEGE 12446]